MQELARWTLDATPSSPAIQLLQGDLTELRAEDEVDLLVVSAFPDDYRPTSGSLIGALSRKGVSVSDLSRAREADLREQFSCWLSASLMLGDSAVRVLCIESGWRGKPPEITDDLFRALATASIVGRPDSVVAMPLIGTGDQGWPADQMLESIFKAAVSWFRRGLPLRALKIVVRGAPQAEAARRHFERLRLEDQQSRESSSAAMDVFLSYSHRDAEIAHAVFERLRTMRPDACVFYDRRSLAPGASWLMEIAQSLDTARRVVAIYTPDYWSSQYCKDEFLAAYIRQRDTGTRVIYPLYAKTAAIPYMFRSLQHEDCREADPDKLAAACDAIYDGL